MSLSSTNTEVRPEQTPASTLSEVGPSEKGTPKKTRLSKFVEGFDLPPLSPTSPLIVGDRPKQGKPATPTAASTEATISLAWNPENTAIEGSKAESDLVPGQKCPHSPILDRAGSMYHNKLPSELRAMTESETQRMQAQQRELAGWEKRKSDEEREFKTSMKRAARLDKEEEEAFIIKMKRRHRIRERKVEVFEEKMASRNKWIDKQRREVEQTENTIRELSQEIKNREVAEWSQAVLTQAAVSDVDDPHSTSEITPAGPERIEDIDTMN